MKKKSFISVILLVSLSGLFTVSWADTGINDNKLITTKENIVMEYIDSMKNNNYQKILQKTNLNNLGKEEYEDNLVNHNNMISVPEKKDYKKSELQLKYQHDAIEASFGKNAWNHIKYEMKKLDHLDGKTVFYNKETGAEITRQEYYSLNEAFWSSVAAKEGITKKELFSFSDCDTDISPDKAYRYYMIYLNNLNHEPTERRIREAYEAYVVNLTFNDKEKTDEMENVHFLISNEDKEWKVKEGLMWSDIIEDCADDEYKILTKAEVIKEYIKELSEGGIESQFNQIVSSFGKDAWDNITYLDGKTGYVNKLTNKSVKEEVYNSLNKQYWERIAKENGISYEKLFDFHNLNLDDATRYKYQSIIMKNWDGMPAESRIFSDYELCQVNLKFNGKDSGTDHLNNFKFYISNETGQWRVCQGLTWDYPEYDSDIVEIDH